MTVHTASLSEGDFLRGATAPIIWRSRRSRVQRQASADPDHAQHRPSVHLSMPGHGASGTGRGCTLPEQHRADGTGRGTRFLSRSGSTRCRAIRKYFAGRDAARRPLPAPGSAAVDNPGIRAAPIQDLVRPVEATVLASRFSPPSQSRCGGAHGSCGSTA